MRVLVTGGAGFIGSHVAERLLERGHEVAIIDDLSSGALENVPGTILKDGRFYEADIRSGCAQVFEEFRPQALCHQAAQMDVRRSVRDPDFDADVNVLGTVRLLQSCVEHDVRKVVFASSGGAIYGEQEEFPATEDHPEYPISPYGVSKLAAERYLHFYEAQYGLSYTALRYANVYGPRQDPHGEAGVVAIFAGNLAAGRGSTINGTGEQTRDYVYVGDVAQANVLALKDDAPSEAYNVGTSVETSVNELYELMRKACRSEGVPRHGAAELGEQLRSCVSSRKGALLLNWRPELDLVSGLERTLMPFETFRHGASSGDANAPPDLQTEYATAGYTLDGSTDILCS